MSRFMRMRAFGPYLCCQKVLLPLRNERVVDKLFHHVCPRR